MPVPASKILGRLPFAIPKNKTVFFPPLFFYILAYLDVLQFLHIRRDVVGDSFASSWQRCSVTEQSKEGYVREYGREIYHFATCRHAAPEAYKDQDPSACQTRDQKRVEVSRFVESLVRHVQDEIAKNLNLSKQLKK